MKLIKGLAFVGLAALLFVSCNKSEYGPYEPAAPDTGAQYYFSTAAQTAYTLTPSTTALNVEVLRYDDSAASTAKVAVADETQKIVAGGSNTFSVNFNAGSKVAMLSIPVDMEKVEFGDAINLNLSITEETTQYAPSTLSIVATLPEPWKSLGKGKLTDNYWYEATADVEFQQNELYPNQFRIVDPFSKMAKAIGSEMSGDPEDYAYLNFRIMNVGDQIGGVTITEPDIVYFNDTSLGYLHSSYDDIVFILHASRFTSRRGMEFYHYTRVLSYQDNGLPAVVQLAPMYYMMNTGGWNKTQLDDQIIMVFPGVVLKDFTISMEYEGILKAADDSEYVLADVEFEGADVSEVALALVAGDDPDAGVAMIEEGDDSVVTVDKAGSTKVPIPAGTEAGKYTVVAVPVDGGEAQSKYAVYFTINYGDLSPMQIDYTANDFVDYVSKEELLGTEWIAWATDDEHGPADREPYSYVTFEDLEDVADDEDIVLAHGLDYGGGDYYGFDGGLVMEWYNGFLYTHSNEKAGEAYGYDVFATYYDVAADVFTRGSYNMYAAKVADGLLALVNRNTTYNFTAVEFAAFDGDTYYGWFTCMNYILLADPAVFPLESVATQAKSMKMRGTKGINDVPIPFAKENKSINRTDRIATGEVIASGKVSAAGKNAAPVKF